jgi:hypothetical protein
MTPTPGLDDKGTPGVVGPHQQSGLRGVARVDAIVYEHEGLWVIIAEMPYDGTTLLARCATQHAAEVLVMAIT